MLWNFTPNLAPRDKCIDMQSVNFELVLFLAINDEYHGTKQYFHVYKNWWKFYNVYDCALFVSWVAPINGLEWMWLTFNLITIEWQPFSSLLKNHLNRVWSYCMEAHDLILFILILKFWMFQISHFNIYLHSCHALLWWKCYWVSWMAVFVPGRKKLYFNDISIQLRQM